MRLVEPKAGSSNGELRQLNSRPGVGSLSPIGPQLLPPYPSLRPKPPGIA